MILICSFILKSRIFSKISLFASILAVLSFIFSTEFNRNDVNFIIFDLIDYVFGFFFLAEVLLRIFGSNIGLGKEIKRPIIIFDIIIMISCFMPHSMLYLRVVRLLRFFKLFQSKRYKFAAIAIRRVWRGEKEELTLVWIFFVMIAFVGASAMYISEGHLQKEFSSIPRCLYWAFITATGVGYGDYVPITSLGRFLSVIISISGLTTYTMLAVIFATGFSKEIEKIKDHEDL